MNRVGIIGTAALSLLLGTAAPVWSQQGKHDEEQGKSDKQAKGKGSAKADSKQQTKGQAQQAAPQAKREQQQPAAQQQRQNQRQQEARQDQRGQQQKEQNQQRAEQQKQVNQERQATRQKQVEDRQNANRQRQANQQKQAEDRKRAEQVRVRPVRVQPVRAQQLPDNRPPGWDKGKKVGWDGGTVPPGHQARLPRDRQQVLITEQQARRLDYRRRLDQQRLLQVQWTTQQQRDRMTYYRYQQDYWARMRRQQLALQRNYNYYNDPYFYTASSYSYSYGGNNYQTNHYGANLLRQAMNNGYAEGYRAGQADRQDRFGGGYQNSYAYQDANLGYNGMYVNQGDYNYYFREGFNRGYQDGYSNQMQYGQYSNGNRSLLGTILSAVLNLQSLR